MSKGSEIISLLRDIDILMEKKLKAYFSNYGVTVTQLSVINILIKKGKVKSNEISEELKITPAAVTLILNRLESQNVIERIRDTKDRRVVYAQISQWFKDSHKHLENNTGIVLDILLKNKAVEETEKIFEGLNLLKLLLNSNEGFEDASLKCPHLKNYE